MSHEAGVGRRRACRLAAWALAGCCVACSEQGAGSSSELPPATTADMSPPGALEPPPPSPDEGRPGEPPTDLEIVGPSDADEIDGMGAAPDAGASVKPDAAVPGDDRCDVGVYDPARPPVALSLSGNLGAHDPVIVAADGLYHYFSTGNGIATKTSPDLLRWTQTADVFPTTPAWFAERVPAYEPRNIWAPDISYFGGQYHL